MIGIMDWGIGGLSVYKTFPGDDVLYFSDSGYTPYGRLERTELRDRLSAVARFYKLHGVSEVRVACNAASSALDADEENFEGVKFSSILPAGVAAVRASEAKRVGVIGGLLTINSGLYQKRLASIDKQFSFAPAQPLSALVERGALSGEEVERAVGDVLSALGDVDAILLACTHYPALSAVFKTLAHEVELLDPAAHVWPQTQTQTSQTQARTQTRTRTRTPLVFTTGSPTQMRTSAQAAWSLDLPGIERVQLG